MYLNGGDRRSVCELCKPRALHEGWVREGSVPAYDGGDAPPERRSLLRRLRTRRAPGSRAAAKPTLADELEGQSWLGARTGFGRAAGGEDAGREPRHVRAVPTSAVQTMASAIELFNSSEHPRTVAGVARSLGSPTVAVLPSEVLPSVVNVVVSWELCWYRYEVDLSEDVSSVRVGASGYELDELQPEQLRANATADEHGRLALG